MLESCARTEMAKHVIFEEIHIFFDDAADLALFLCLLFYFISDLFLMQTLLFWGGWELKDGAHRTAAFINRESDGDVSSSAAEKEAENKRRRNPDVATCWHAFSQCRLVRWGNLRPFFFFFNGMIKECSEVSEKPTCGTGHTLRLIHSSKTRTGGGER